jgi:hypothetical protein
VCYAGDVWDYIQFHRIEYRRLKEIKWDAQPRRGPESLRQMSKYLVEAGVLSGLGPSDDYPERKLIVLDSDLVSMDERWQELFKASDNMHATGPDPRRRTVVFTSISLLGNAVWCRDMDWDVCGCVDGTHGMTTSSYKLITFGVFGFSDSKKCRTFHPITYTFGEGEREIVALHGFLNLIEALLRLFGISNVQFKRGIVSDATNVFVNAIDRAFPGTVLLTCYPHIIRKFMWNDRKGNGGYVTRLSRQPRVWLTREAEQAVRRLSLCKTQRQFNLMWELTQKKWNEDGESALADTFAKTYIHDPNFCRWFYAASGRHGSVPCNNPMERHNLAIKGTSNFAGYVEIGKDMYSCLTKEFVTLVDISSYYLSSPSSGYPVVDYEKAASNHLFMKFQSLLDPSTDMKKYGNGWLVNDVHYLSQQITDDDVTRMEMAMVGVLGEEEGEHDVRHKLLQYTQRFHVVTPEVGTTENGNVLYFACDCRDYYFNRWCFQSAFVQHREQLQLLGKRISNCRRPSAIIRKTNDIAKALQDAALKKNRTRNMTNKKSKGWRLFVRLQICNKRS